MNHGAGQKSKTRLSKVKKMVTEAPILSYYDLSSPLPIQCDTSHKGLGATLLQNQKPVTYTSRALTDIKTLCPDRDASRRLRTAEI